MSDSNPSAPWIPARSLVNPVLKENIHYLSLVEPVLFNQLKQNREKEELLLQACQGFHRCRTANEPVEWLFGQNDVRHEWQAMQERVRRIPPDATVVLFLGTTLGYALQYLYPTFLQSSRMVILAVEPTAIRMQTALAPLDIRKGILSGRLHLAICPLEKEHIFQEIHRFHLWGHDRIHIYSDDRAKALAEAVLDEYPTRSQEKERQRVGIQQALNTHAREKTDKKVERVLLFDCWSRYPQGLHIQSIHKALLQKGLQSQIVRLEGYRIDENPAQYRRRYFGPLLNRLEQYKPDLVLSYAYHAPQIVGRELFDALQVPWVQVVSNIAYHDNEYYKKEFNALCEERLIPLYKKRGAQHPFFLPLMANHVAKKPVQTTRRYPIVFVGNPLRMPAKDVREFQQAFSGRDALWPRIQQAERE
ncbi:hypothetical protein GF373_08060, partial [bacterium]|nr:hypothetical protein [bacterium]